MWRHGQAVSPSVSLCRRIIGGKNFTSIFREISCKISVQNSSTICVFVIKKSPLYSQIKNVI